VRLQKNDFFVLSLPEKDAALRFQIAGGPLRGAYTDKKGYAGAVVPVPAEVGEYQLVVSHLDRQGEEITADAPAYVWDAGRRAAAVDLDCLPMLPGRKLLAARSAMMALSADANIVYLTTEGIHDHDKLHRRLKDFGYPDGPILIWQREHWRIERDDMTGFRRVIIAENLVSQLDDLKRIFVGLDTGVCDSTLAAKVFSRVGLQTMVIGDDGEGVPNVRRFKSWEDLSTGVQP